jgi:type VI secretion system secreted protein Hcp
MAAVDYFLKLEGIEGESTDHKHKNEIALQSWSWGETQQAAHDHSASGGSGAGKVSMQDFHFTALFSKASAALLMHCASGTHIKKADLVCRKAGKDQQEFLKYTLSEIIVTSYQTGGSAHGDTIPVDQVSLNFAKVELEYKGQKADGSLAAPVKAGWDLKANKKV